VGRSSPPPRAKLVKGADSGLVKKSFSTSYLFGRGFSFRHMRSSMERHPPRLSLLFFPEHFPTLSSEERVANVQASFRSLTFSREQFSERVRFLFFPRVTSDFFFIVDPVGHPRTSSLAEVSLFSSSLLFPQFSSLFGAFPPLHPGDFFRKHFLSPKVLRYHSVASVRSAAETGIKFSFPATAGPLEICRRLPQSRSRNSP